MADNAPANSIIEGTVKFRDGKKWKSRWCVMRKLSPVADCVHLQLYKDLKERQKNGQTKASLSLQQYLGFESGFTLDKESNTLAVLCEDVSPILAFDTRETLMHWRVKFQHNLGSSKEFAAVLITAPPASKINSGPVRIHACGSKLALCGSRPPEVLTLWDVKLLRRYGIVEKRFCLEGGTRCGRGEGLFVFATERGRELVELLDISRDTQRMSSGSRCSSVLEKRFSDSTSCFDDSFLRSSSPSWMPTSQTMHCLDLDQSFDENQFFRRPTSLPRCTSCVGKIGSQLTRSSTMSTTPMSPIWTMENIMEKRSESDRASMYSQSSGSDYSVPRSVMEKSFESKRLSPIGCCTPTIPVKVGIGCQCWQHKTCCCRKKFSGPFENYDVPKTPMPLIQEHPADISLEASSLYDTPKKLKCILNGSSCECQHTKVNDSKDDDDDANVPDINTQENNETHSNYVNITPVKETKNQVLNNYANLDLTATLEKFETSLQILKSAGFSQEDLDGLEDIPEHDDSVSNHQSTECCNDHINYLHMGPLDSNSSSKHSDEVSRISHSSDPNHNSDTDNTISSKRSSSADFTKKEEDIISNKSMCFTPTVLRKSTKAGYSTLPLRIESGSIEKSFKIPESKTEISLVARLRESVRIRRSSSVPSKSDKNRDSSSSNDSGVSTGSLKHHKCDFNEFEICVNNSKSQKTKCIKNRKSSTPAELSTFMKSSDPMKSLTFQFEEVSELAKMNSCNDTLTRRKKNLVETDNTVRHSQMTNKSTSSGASDTSDYMESLSVSSFSSCDVHTDRHVTRPRSGKEYASIDRTAL